MFVIANETKQSVVIYLKFIQKLIRLSTISFAPNTGTKGYRYYPGYGFRFQLSIINYQLSIKNKRAKVTLFSKMSQFFLYDGDADETDFADFHGYFY